jgi:hypothetical protein
MSGFLASPGFIDVVLALVVLEGAGLFLLRRLTGQGPGLGPVWPSLAAGALLVLGLRIAIAGGSPIWLVCALIGSLLAHAVDVRARWAGP